MAERERPNAEIIVAADGGQVQQCIDIRIEGICHNIVFHREQKFPLETEIDEYDKPGRAVHFLLRSVPEHQSMGTLRMIEKPLEYKLGRLCILKEYRGLHFGEDLVRNAHSWVIVQSKLANRPAEISLHSQIYAKAFYSREGYVAEGPEFDEDGAPHQRMVWRAPRAKSADTGVPIELR